MAERVGLSRAQKALLIWSGLFLLGAEIVNRLQVVGKAATRIGLVEVVLAALTGIAFGLAASDSKK